MTFQEIREFPTTFIGANGGRHHESLLRSYQILQKVKELCAIECPHSLIVEMIDDMANNPQRDYASARTKVTE